MSAEDGSRPFYVYLANGERLHFAQHYFSTHQSGVLEIATAPHWGPVMFLSPSHWTHIKYAEAK